MNYLAHLHLSFDDPAVLVGNFIADSLKPAGIRALPRDIARGVKLHQEIDGFMDRHPLVRLGSQRLKDRHFRYAPVVMDIFYDYFLAKHWAQFGRQPIDEFARFVYDVLMQYLPYLPASLQRSVPKMIEHNWLLDYGHYEGMERVFMKFSRKVSRPEWLEHILATLQTDEALLEAEFLEYFPQAEANALTFINGLKGS